MPGVWKHFRPHPRPEILPGILRADAVFIVPHLPFQMLFFPSFFNIKCNTDGLLALSPEMLILST
jgi:hypothetical protein